MADRSVVGECELNYPIMAEVAVGEVVVAETPTEVAQTRNAISVVKGVILLETAVAARSHTRAQGHALLVVADLTLAPTPETGADGPDLDPDHPSAVGHLQ